ncbi:MAG: tRNA pseudouridine(55) synthase TruB [Burkholderiales bacterium]
MSARADRRRVDGVLLLDKPAGVSSNAALQRAKRALGALKAGHTGTLDPLATGLLPIAFGEATKFAQGLLDASKAYEAIVRFGASTTTGDAEGDVVDRGPVPATREAVESRFPAFLGALLQVPPRHAALKHRGRPYYEWARAGVEIERRPREVVIHALRLLDWRPPDATIVVACGKGTYVRVLAEDLGRAAGTCAHLAGLRRIATGGFDVRDAISLDALEALEPSARVARLLPVDTLVADLPRVELDARSAERFAHGGGVAWPGTPVGRCAVFARGALLGLASVDHGLLRPARLVAPPDDGAPRSS